MATKEVKNKRLTNELLEWVKTGGGYGLKTQQKVVELFGKEENEKLLALSGSKAFQTKKTKIRQLLQEKRVLSSTLVSYKNEITSLRKKPLDNAN